MTRRCVVLAVAAVMMGMLALSRDIDDAEAHTGCNQPWARPDGMWIQPQNDPDQYLIEDCRKRHFIAPLDVVSHYLPTSVPSTISNEEDAALPEGVGYAQTIRAREGTLFRYTPTGAIYIIDEMGNGTFQKRYVDGNGWNAYFVSCAYGTGDWIETSDAVYLGGYPDGAPVTAAFPRPDGQLIKSSTSGTVYQVTGGAKSPFSTDLARFSYNFQQPVCTTGTANYVIGATLRAREGTLFKGTGAALYVIEKSGTNYYKRWITSPASRTFYGLDAPTLWTWFDSEVNSYLETFHVHPVKTNWARVWNKNLATNDLGTYAPASSWDGEIAGARSVWNSSPVAPDFFVDSTAPYDVEFQPGFYGIGGYFGRADPVPIEGPAPITNFIVRLDSSDWPLGNQGVVAHELGHVLLLAHDGLDPDTDGDGLENPDFECGPPFGGLRVPATLMDYDCEFTYGVSAPTNWDFCGVNHKLTSSYVYAGC